MTKAVKLQDVTPNETKTYVFKDNDMGPYLGGDILYLASRGTQEETAVFANGRCHCGALKRITPYHIEIQVEQDTLVFTLDNATVYSITAVEFS